MTLPSFSFTLFDLAIYLCIFYFDYSLFYPVGFLYIEVYVSRAVPGFCLWMSIKYFQHIDLILTPVVGKNRSHSEKSHSLPLSITGFPQMQYEHEQVHLCFSGQLYTVGMYPIEAIKIVLYNSGLLYTISLF